MTNEQVTAEMQFAIFFLEELAERHPDNTSAARALAGVNFMSMALDGLSNMMRMLPVETQRQIAEDMYALVGQNKERMQLMT
jgi:hypothetical protein